MKFNINAQVRVRLTKLGAAAHNAHHRLALSERSWTPKAEGDVLEVPLWDLMHIFGPHCFMGSPIQPFKDNEIEFTMGVEQAGWLVTPPGLRSWWEPDNNAQFKQGTPHKIEPLYKRKEL